MKLADVRKNAFAMPLNNPAYPRGPYRFYNREFVVISYRTDPEILRAVARDRQGCLGVYGSTVEPGRVEVGDPVLIESPA